MVQRCLYNILHLITCRSSQTGETPTDLVAGLVSNVFVALDISNQGDDAFQAILSFSLPSTLLEFVRVDPRSVSCSHAVHDPSPSAA